MHRSPPANAYNITHISRFVKTRGALLRRIDLKSFPVRRKEPLKFLPGNGRIYSARCRWRIPAPKRQRGLRLIPSLTLFDLGLFVLCPKGARENSQGLPAPGS